MLGALEASQDVHVPEKKRRRPGMIWRCVCGHAFNWKFQENTMRGGERNIHKKTS